MAGGRGAADRVGPGTLGTRVVRDDTPDDSQTKCETERIVGPGTGDLKVWGTKQVRGKTSPAIGLCSPHFHNVHYFGRVRFVPHALSCCTVPSPLGLPDPRALPHAPGQGSTFRRGVQTTEGGVRTYGTSSTTEAGRVPPRPDGEPSSSDVIETTVGVEHISGLPCESTVPDRGTKPRRCRTPFGTTEGRDSKTPRTDESLCPSEELLQVVPLTELRWSWNHRLDLTLGGIGLRVDPGQGG